MRFVIFMILAVISTSCTKEEYYPSTKSLLADDISLKVFLQMKKEKNLYPCGTGGQMMDEIKMLYLAFDYYNEIDIGQARELLMAAGNLFLKEINAEERIHQYLIQYPFQPKNIKIAIFLRKPDGSLIEHDKLHVVSLKGGVLRYNITEASHGYLTTVYEETFEEAEAKLQNL